LLRFGVNVVAGNKCNLTALPKSIAQTRDILALSDRCKALLFDILVSLKPASRMRFPAAIDLRIGDRNRGD